MADSIQISGYEVTVPNMWWRKDMHGGKQSMSVFMRMIKYAVPDGRQVVACVKARATKANYEHLQKIQRNEAVKTPVETALSILPEEIFEEFKGGNPKIYNHLGRHIEYGIEQAGRTYLDMDRWIIPTHIFDLGRDFPDVTLPNQDEILTTIMHRHGQKERGFLMMLEGHANLPESERMKSLLEAQVRSSRQFSTGCNFDDYEKLARDVRQIYEALEATGARNVQDNSGEYLQLRGLGAVNNTWGCMQKQALLKGIITEVIPGILSAIEQAESEPDKKGKPKGSIRLDDLSCDN